VQLKKNIFFRLVKESSETMSSMGRSTRYYMNTYEDFHKEKKCFPSWNWASFLSALFGAELVWMIYRRMYFYAFLYFFFLFLLTNVGFLILYFVNKNLSPDLKSMLLQKFSDKDFLFFSLKVVLWVIKLPIILGFGVWGNALYFKFLEKEARKKYLPKSGVSSPAAGGLLLILVGLMLLNNYLLQTANTNLYSRLHDLFL